MNRTENCSAIMRDHMAKVSDAQNTLRIACELAGRAASSFLATGQLVSYRDPSAPATEPVLARVKSTHGDGSFTVTSLRTGRERRFEFHPSRLDAWQFRLVDEEDRDE